MSHRLRANLSPLSLRNPRWMVVVAVMLVLGYIQEQAKIDINHYLTVGDEQAFWHESAEARASWWTQSAPENVHDFYISKDTWDVFHSLNKSQLIELKWGFSALILMVFFGLDVLLLMVVGLSCRIPWLMAFYMAAGIPMVGFLWAIPGDVMYTLAHDMLAFLQSPLPSLLIVLVPWFFNRIQPN